MPPLPALTVVFSRPRLIACLLLVFMAAQATAFTYQGYLLTVRTELQQKMTARFGDKAGPRMAELAEALNAAGRIADEAVRVERINQIANRARYMTDAQLWQSEDYWATPVEFAALAAGDCELLAGQVLRAARTGHAGRQAAHHLCAPAAPGTPGEPHGARLLPGTRRRALGARQSRKAFHAGARPARPDAGPSFNDDRVWKVQSGGDRELGSPQQLRKWRELLDRVEAEVRG